MGPPMMELLRWDGDTITVRFSTNDWIDRSRQLHPAAVWEGRLLRTADSWYADVRPPAEKPQLSPPQ
jgi:hypothetical protein